MPANLKVIFEIATKGLDGISRVSGQIDKFGKDTEKALKRSATSFRTLATFTGGIVAFETIRRTINKSVQEYAKQEEAVARLTNVLGYESNVLIDLAAQRQKVTKYTDDDTIAMTAEMGVLIKNEQRLRTLVPLVQDFASAKGIDLASAGNLVARTLQSETNALQRQGITIKGAAGSTERFTMLVNQLTAAVGGNAEAVGKTASGQMAIFKNSVDELYESLGKVLMPTIIDIVSVLNRDFIPAIDRSIGFIDNMITGFKVIAGISLSDPLKDMTLLNEKIAKQEELLAKRTRQQGFLGWAAGIVGTAGTESKMIAESLAELYKQRDELQLKVNDLLNPGKPKGTTRRDDIVGTKETKGKKGLTASGVWLKQVEDDYKAAVDVNKQFYDLQKSKLQDIETDYQEAIKVNEDFRRNQFEINRRYDEAQLLQIQDSGQYQLEMMRSQHLAELQSLTLTEDQKTKLIKAHRLEEFYFERQINQQRVQDNLNATVGIISALSSAAAAEVAIEKNRKEQMKPIQRAFAIMEFAAGTAAAITSAWNTAKSNYYLGIALTAEALIQNGAMLATQLQAINTARTGADYVTNGRQMLIVGDNPGGRERVQVTPLSSPNMKGPVNNDNSVGSVNIYVNDQLTGERLIKAIRSGAMRSGLSDLKRALANA